MLFGLTGHGADRGGADRLHPPAPLLLSGEAEQELHRAVLVVLQEGEPHRRPAANRVPRHAALQRGHRHQVAGRVVLKQLWVTNSEMKELTNLADQKAYLHNVSVLPLPLGQDEEVGKEEERDGLPGLPAAKCSGPLPGTAGRVTRAVRPAHQPAGGGEQRHRLHVPAHAVQRGERGNLQSS